MKRFLFRSLVVFGLVAFFSFGQFHSDYAEQAPQSADAVASVTPGPVDLVLDLFVSEFGPQPVFAANTSNAWPTRNFPAATTVNGNVGLTEELLISSAASNATSASYFARCPQAQICVQHHGTGVSNAVYVSVSSTDIELNGDVIYSSPASGAQCLELPKVTESKVPYDLRLLYVASTIAGAKVRARCLP